MDRRRFLFRSPPDPPADPPFEVLPGVFVEGPVDFRYRAARPDATPVAPIARSKAAGTTSLAPFVPSADVPWDARRARHLLRRTAVAAPPEAVEAVLALSPTDAVDALVDRVLALGVDPEPSWYLDSPPHWTEPRSVQDAYWDTNWERVTTVYRGVFDDLCGLDAPADPLDEAARAFRHRLTVLWHNHFVTHLESYALAPWLARYWRLLQRHALGDFRAFVADVGLDPAMLVYLNGADNRAWAPNENYARELLELFTMGITGPDGSPTYTEADIAEIARALTGYGLDYYGETDTPLAAVFVPDWHDAGPKTVLGQTGRWGYDDVVRIVFEERTPQIAHRIAGLLYRSLVSDTPDEAVIAALADRLVAEDFALEPVVRTLLKSEHFFDAALLGSRTRSPIEHNCAAYREIGARPDAGGATEVGTVGWMCHVQGQTLFEPPTVAGWTGGRDWLDTSRLTSRWEYTSWVRWWNVSYRDLAAAFPDPWTASALAADLADAFLGVPLDGADRDALTDILLDGIPDYEWNPLAEGAERRIRGLVSHLVRLPEFQLA